VSFSSGSIKHCYIILCHDNSFHVSKIVDFLSSESTAFVIHLDKKSKINMEWVKEKKNCAILDHAVAVSWGTFSMVQATLNSLEYASRLFPSSERFTLLSGSCFPCKSKSYIENFFSRNSNTDFFNHEKMSSSKSKPLARVKCIIPSFTNGNRNLIKLLSKFPLRIFGYPVAKNNFYCGSQWFSVTAGTYRNLLNTLDSDYINFFKYTYIPDESFFQTLFVGLKVSESYLPSVTHADWSEGLPSPSWLTLAKCQELLALKKQHQVECLFVRKVNLVDMEQYNDWIHYLEGLKDV
jgi:hypothetical protein